MDPDIRLQKATTPSAVRILTHNDRTPDVGIGILICIPSCRAGEEYYGEYIGHGQSKTAFELHCPGARFNGKVLKVARADDKEPAVFAEAAIKALTTRIYYNCHGVDAESGRRYRCWITDRTIALDEFTREYAAIRRNCTLAAFRCILNAAVHGLYLYD